MGRGVAGRRQLGDLVSKEDFCTDNYSTKYSKQKAGEKKKVKFYGSGYLTGRTGKK